MEISKMLTISTAHIHPYHVRFLDNEVNCDEAQLVIYKKGEYGWFIYTGEIVFEEWEDAEIPFSIKDCMMFARKNNCDWLCLDRDGEVIYNLLEYE